MNIPAIGRTRPSSTALKSENTDLFPQQAELAQQWNKAYAYPTLQYSGFQDALENIAKQFGNDIPTMRGDGGPYWEDGIAADAYYAAMERQNESRGPSAEKLATLTSLVNPHLAADKVESRPDVDEYGADGRTHLGLRHQRVRPDQQEAVQQLAVKNSYAVTARAMADWVSRNSMTSLVDSISAGEGSLIVFNTLNWKRSGPVSLDLNKGDEIVDKSTGQIVPMEVLHERERFPSCAFYCAGCSASRLQGLSDATRRKTARTCGNGTNRHPRKYVLSRDA